VRVLHILGWILPMCVLAACAGSKDIALFSGTCGSEHDACLSRCAALKDPRECKFGCDFGGRRCENAQGGAASGFAGDYEVAIVDLMGKRPFHSKAVKVTLSGASVGKGGHVLAPGGSLKLDFMLPATTRDAELVVTHAPEGTGTACFVTMTFADQTLVGRYAPPKADKGRARVERWNLTPHLADPVQGGEERGYTLFIYNNQNAGSTEGYRLAGVELYYRVE
jgi:hypothetical protein